MSGDLELETAVCHSRGKYRDILKFLDAHREGAEADARVWCALNGKKYLENWPDHHAPNDVRVSYTEPPKRSRQVHREVVPAVTRSVDAALKLAREQLPLAQVNIESRRGWSGAYVVQDSAALGWHNRDDDKLAYAICLAVFRTLNGDYEEPRIHDADPQDEQ